MSNRPNHLARWGGSALLVAAMLATAPGGALASDAGVSSYVAPAAPASPAAVLWDQTAAGNTGGGTTASSKFEPLFSTYDSQAADDFENTPRPGRLPRSTCMAPTRAAPAAPS